MASEHILTCHLMLLVAISFWQISMSANPSPSAVTASVLTTPEVMNVRVILGLNQALTCAIATVSILQEL